QTVSMIDTATNKVVGTPITVGFPYGVAITPDGRKVYVTSFDTVSVIKTATNKVVATIPVLAGGGLAVTTARRSMSRTLARRRFR
ncbi:MAG: YncE family protein, partial [Beijerinckiaceae bacterium]